MIRDVLYRLLVLTQHWKHSMLLRKNFGLLTLIRAQFVLTVPLRRLYSRKALDLQSRVNGWNLDIGGKNVLVLHELHFIQQICWLLLDRV